MTTILFADVKKFNDIKVGAVADDFGIADYNLTMLDKNKMYHFEINCIL